jgi:hypothetical protein
MGNLLAPQGNLIMARARTHIRARREIPPNPGETPMGAPSELTAKIRNLVEARERSTSAIQDLKNHRKSVQGEWVQALADETAMRELSLDGLVRRHREAKEFQERLHERITAAEFFVAALETQLGGYKKSSADAVAFFLKEKVRQLSEKRDAQQKDKSYLNARIENLLRELKELEPGSSVSTKGGKN